MKHRNNREYEEMLCDLMDAVADAKEILRRAEGHVGDRYLFGSPWTRKAIRYRRRRKPTES